jgi:hypothetical protein
VALSCWTAVLATSMMTAAPLPRPKTVDFVEDTATGVRCHWQRDKDESLCVDVLEAALVSWQTQIVQGGWPEPFSDGQRGGSGGLDIYLNTDAEGGAYTWSNYQDADPEDGRFASSSYVVIDPRVEALHLYVAHEFNHVLQFAVDTTEPSYVPWEAAATLAEEQSYPGQGSMADSAPDFQRTPWESLLGDGSHLWEAFDIWSYYEYGSALWMSHLFHQWGVEPVDLWWAMTNETWQNEPDVWDAVEALTGDADAALVLFSLERGRVGRDDAAGWLQDLEAPIRIQGSLQEWDKETAPAQLVQDLGVAYFDFEFQGRYILRHDPDPDTRWRVMDVESGTELLLNEDTLLEGPHRIAWVNLGPADLDVDTHCEDYCAFPGRSLSVWAEFAPEVEDTDPGEVLEPAACACSAGPPRHLKWAFWAPLVLLWRRRP